MSEDIKKAAESFASKIRPKGTAGDEATNNNQSEDDAIAKLQQENADLKESLLRALADSQNTTKRLMQEKDSSVKYAISSLVKDISLTMDNFYLSVSSVKKEDLEATPALKNFFDAINITLNEVSKLLEKNGVRRINPVNQLFNPKEHEAVSQIKADGVESGLVVQVLSAGYALEDRIIKPAMVIVSA